MLNGRFNDEDDDKEQNKKKLMKRDQHDPFCSGIVASSRAKILYPLAPSPSRRTGFTHGRFWYIKDEQGWEEIANS